MFISLRFDSVNSSVDLRAGEYRSNCILCGKTGSALRGVLFEYTRADEPAPTAYDVVLLTDESTVILARDYVWMPDRSWRDSAGTRADDLRELMPPDFLALNLVHSQVGETFLVE